MAVPQIVSPVLLVAGVVVALVLLIKHARGRSRVTGMVGAILMLLGGLSGLAYVWLLASYHGQLSDDTLIAILAARAVIGSVLTGAGVVLLSCAIVVANPWPKKRKRGARGRTQAPTVKSSR